MNGHGDGTTAATAKTAPVQPPPAGGQSAQNGSSKANSVTPVVEVENNDNENGIKKATETELKANNQGLKVPDSKTPSPGESSTKTTVSTTVVVSQSPIIGQKNGTNV